MARPSAASLAVVQPLLPLPDAPPELMKDEAVVWDAVVATKPADWFTDDTHPLLVQYCRLTVRARVIAAQLSELDAAADSFADLFRLELSVSSTMAMLATKMRLAQQSKYGARHAETQARKTAPGKPWEFRKGA